MYNNQEGNFSKAERKVIHRLRASKFDTLILNGEEYKILSNYKFENDEQLEFAREYVFNVDSDKRLFNGNFIIKNGESDYYFNFIKDSTFVEVIYVKSGSIVSCITYDYVNNKSDLNRAELMAGTKYMNQLLNQTRLFTSNIFKVENEFTKLLIRHVETNSDNAVNLALAIGHYVINNTVLKKVTNEKRTSPVATKNSSTSKKGNKTLTLTRVIYLREGKEKENRDVKWNKDSWDVRGHWRVTKTGKRIWVKPYVKGNKDKIKKESKVYKLK